MVKIQAFQGHTYSANDYERLLKFNHEGLSLVKQHKKTYVHRTPTKDQIRLGMIQPDIQPFYYIYRQRINGIDMVGVLVESSIEDYKEGKIKVHEKTLCRPGYNHESYRMDHVGPVILSFRQKQSSIRHLLHDYVKKNEPYSKWTTVDGRAHALWKMDQSAEFIELFTKIDCVYVLDGHHRLQAACDNYDHVASRQAKDNWFLSLYYPPEEVTIHPFHRVLTNHTEQYNVMSYIQNKGIKFTPIDTLRQQHLEEFQAIYKNEEICVGITFQSLSRHGLESLSVYKLKKCILDELYGGHLEGHLQFLPGVTCWDDIMKRSNIFLMRPIKIDEIFDVADEGQIMPPKSTWFEPKPCNKMIVRLPY